VLTFIIFIVLWSLAIIWLRKAFGEVADLSRVESKPSSSVALPQPIRLFEEFLRSIDHTTEHDGEILWTMFGLRGAHIPGDGPDVKGAVCHVNIQMDADGIVLYRVWLPVPVPEANRDAVFRLCSNWNALAYFGSWQIDMDSGDCWFRVWTYAVDGEIPEWVPEAVFGQVEGSIDAREFCDAAYGPLKDRTSP